MIEYKKLPAYNGGFMLNGIYEYQKALMEEYQVRGMLPRIVKIEDREGQAFLKKGIYWVTEELIEAKKEYDQAMELWKGNSDTREAGIVTCLEKFFGELGDTLHFLVELMIYSGIESDDVLEYYRALCEQRNLAILVTSDGLSTSCNYGQQTNNFDDQVRVTLFNSYRVNEKLKVKISDDLHQHVKLTMLEVIASLHSAGNELKKRDWKVAEDNITPVQLYHLKLMEAWLYFFKLTDLVGLGPLTVYHYYEKMNFKNQERLAKKY